MADDKAKKESLSQVVPTQPQDESTVSQPTEAATTPAVDPSATLDAREAEITAREEAANATLARAEAVAKTVEDNLKKASEISAGLARPSEANDEVSATEKANVVTLLLQKAFADKDLGDVVPFTPAVTMANNTEAGLITFEQGIEYKVPKAIVDDLVDRQNYYLRYKESLHVRSVVDSEVGRISGAGK